MGSVNGNSSIASIRLKAGLAHARELASESKLPEADATHSDEANIRTRAPAPVAPVVETDLELWCSFPLLDLALLSHIGPLRSHFKALKRNA